MDLSITPCVLSLLLVGISYAQEIKVYPSYKSIRRETSQNGLLITCEVDGLADDQNANLEWLDPADNVIGPYNSAIKSRIYSRQMGTSNQNLRFDTLKDGDEGVYTCRGTIGGNTITNDIRLELYDGIKVLSNHTQQPNIYTDAVIACAVTANPSPTVQWTFGNGTKVRGERYRLLPQGLEIKNITMADNGVYICSIILIETGDLLPFHINVTVTVPPSLKGPPTRSTAIVGKRFEMTCVADGTPRPSFTFKKDKLVLSGQRYKVSITNDVNETRGMLVIEHLQNTDEGTYSCIAHNQGGNVSESVFIDTIAPPIIDPIINKTETEGYAVELVCVAKGDPAPMVTWRVKGSDIPISASQDITIEYQHEKLPLIQVTTVKLKFARLEQKNANNYTCSASNEAGTVEKDGNVVVQFKPYFADTPYSSTYGWVNHKSEIKCVANAVPLAVIIWKYNDAIITDGPFFSVSSKQGNRQMISILEVSVNVENENTIFRNFTCEALNLLGKSEKVFTLKQAVEPASPTISIGVMTPMTIELIITPPEETGGPPVTDYRVVYYAKGDEQNRFARMAPVGTNSQKFETQLLLDNLEANVLYVISAEARNSVGYGAKAAIFVSTPAVRQPSPPKVTSPRSSDTPHTYLLVWEKPETGGSPLTGYKVRYYQVELYDGNPEKVKTVVGDRKTLTISQDNKTEVRLTELMPNSTYELQITAINAIGVSMATRKLVTTPPVQFKPNFADTPYSSTYGWVNHKSEIKCVANAVPPAVIIWKYSDAIITDGPFFSIRSKQRNRQMISILEVSVNVENENTIFGKFTCVAENTLGVSEKDIILKQAVKPSAPSISVDRLTPRSFRLLITKSQETGGPPIINYMIVYYAQDDVKNKFKMRVPVNANPEELQTQVFIDYLEAKVKYNIRVKARNSVGYGAKAKISAKTLVYPPLSLEVPAIVNDPIVGTKFVMTCSAKGSPYPSLIFQKDNTTLSGERYKMGVLNDVDRTDGILLIEHLRNTDEGTYSCVAHNQGGNVSESVFIDTIVPPIIEPIINKTEREGNAVELVCVAKGDPAPMVTWRVKGSHSPISDSPVVRVFTIEEHVEVKPPIHVRAATLTFTRLQPEHANNYTCTAANVAGTDEKDGNIIVESVNATTVGPTPPSSGTVERKDIECTAGTMDIHIPRTLLPTHNVTLRDPTCVVPSNGTHLVISISFNQCGTTVSFSNDTVVFSNELVATVIQASHPSSIVDYGLSKDDQRVSLECVYKRHSSVELDYMPMMRAAHFYEKRYGNLDFAVKHYTNEQFTTEIAYTDIPTGVNLNTEIFIDLVVDQHQTKDIGIYVPSCFATPTPSPTDPLFYPLIRSSCPAQADVRRFTAPDINEFRFSFLAFKFTRAPMQKPHASMPAVPMVYIHCQVSACPRGNCTSSCNSANGGRMKRAALGDSSHLISSGPFYLKTDESTTGYSSIVVAVTMSVAVAATVVAMAAIVAWRRSASKLSAYKSLRLNMDS